MFLCPKRKYVLMFLCPKRKYVLKRKNHDQERNVEIRLADPHQHSLRRGHRVRRGELHELTQSPDGMTDGRKKSSADCVASSSMQPALVVCKVKEKRFFLIRQRELLPSWLRRRLQLWQPLRRPSSRPMPLPSPRSPSSRLPDGPWLQPSWPLPSWP